jgi:recombination protein RecA
MPQRDSFLNEIFEKFGNEIAVRNYSEGVPSISTGSLAIDVSTGIGGVPRGRFTEVYGPEGSGKTTLLLSIAKQAMNSGLKVLYIDTENSLDYAYAKEVVGDFTDDQMIILQPESGEDAFSLALISVEHDFPVILFDSVAAISPEKELEEPMDKQQVGLTPRLTSKFLRKIAYLVRTKEIAFVFSNQVRANIGAYMGGYVTPAGFALKHYTSLRIYLSKSDEIKIDKTAIGNFVKFVIKKNKVGRPYRQATTNIIWGKGVDYHRDVISFAALLGIIRSRGSYYSFDGEIIGNKPGTINAINTLKENKELLDKIVGMCYNVAGSAQFIEEVANAEVESDNGS